MTKTTPPENFPDAEILAPEHDATSKTPPVNSLVRQQVVISPLPPPEYLEHYERVHPGTTKHLLEQLKVQQEHHHKLELKTLDAKIRDARLGQ